MDREKSFIEALVKSGATAGVGDDGVPLGDFIIASDAFFEGVHFKRAWSSLNDIVEKCFLVNLSDIYAMNAIPQFALLSISLPSGFKDSSYLAKIIGDCAKKWGVKIIGGDTIISDKLCFSLTMIGKRRKKILTRSGVKKGNIVGFITPNSVLNGIKTQKFGNNFKNLKIALRFYKNARIPQSTRFNKPLLYPQMLFRLNKIAKSGMDISDGIFLELTRLSALNRVGFKFIKKLGFWLYSPEEYQMLYVIDKRNLKKMQNSTKRFRHRFIPFAIAVRGKYKSKHKNWHC